MNKDIKKKLGKCHYCGLYSSHTIEECCDDCNKILKDNSKNQLRAIFQKQLLLQERLGFSKTELFHNQKFININLLAIFDELCEAMRETSWKNPLEIEYGWKKTQLFNSENFKEELIDVFHFFINLCIAAGIEPEQLLVGYLNKNKINHKRQDKGY